MLSRSTASDYPLGAQQGTVQDNEVTTDESPVMLQLGVKCGVE